MLRRGALRPSIREYRVQPVQVRPRPQPFEDGPRLVGRRARLGRIGSQKHDEVERRAGRLEVKGQRATTAEHVAVAGDRVAPPALERGDAGPGCQPFDLGDGAGEWRCIDSRGGGACTLDVPHPECRPEGERKREGLVRAAAVGGPDRRVVGGSEVASQERPVRPRAVERGRVRRIGQLRHQSLEMCQRIGSRIASGRPEQARQVQEPCLVRRGP